MVHMAEIIDKAKASVYSLFRSQESDPPNDCSTKLMPIDELPIYPSDENKLGFYRFIEDAPLLGEKYISDFRQSAQKSGKKTFTKFEFFQRFANSTINGALKMNSYLKQDENSLPKAVAITVGGMAGFLFSLKNGGTIKRFFYSGAGMSIVAAFCYPNETVNLVRKSLIFTRKEWDQFSAAPTPPKKMESDETVNSNENIDMYSTRSSKIS